MIEEGCLTSDLFSMGCTIDPTNMHNCDIRRGAFLECRDLLWPFAGKSYIFISICELRPIHAALQCVVSQVDGCGECSISPLWSSELRGQANHHAIYMGWMYFFKKVNLMQLTSIGCTLVRDVLFFHLKRLQGTNSQKYEARCNNPISDAHNYIIPTLFWDCPTKPSQIDWDPSPNWEGNAHHPELSAAKR
jgi:hypothetical protein